MSNWTFFSNHGHVLVCLERDHKARLRDVAREVGITERAVQKIVRDLQDAGYLEVSKQGRCNRYRINKRRSLRHGLVSHCSVGKLLALVARPARPGVAVEPAEAVREAPEAAPEPKVSPRAAGSEAAKKKPAPKTAKKTTKKTGEESSAPLDTRQQGSLF
jgi:DNA-binding Lrp family transcriptional regulator